MTTLAATLLAGGCASTSPAPVEPALEERTEIETSAWRLEPRRGTAGASVEGRPIAYTVWNEAPAGSGRSVVMIIASIHGEEPAGTPLLAALSDRLARDRSLLRGRTLVLVPAANPDGLERGARRNVRGVDLNRNFPARNFDASTRHGGSALSEPESRALHDLIERYEPEVLVSIHQPLACVDWDGPAEALAEAMAAAGPLPVRKLGTRPGSLGAWAGELKGIATITLELPRGVERLGPDELWSRYGQMLLVALE